MENDDRHFTHLLTVLSVSSGMVGVCLTAIGLIGVMKSLTKLEVYIDDLLAVDALIFMVTAVLSFLAARTPLRSNRGFAIALDVIFCVALAITAVAATLLAWLLI